MTITIGSGLHVVALLVACAFGASMCFRNGFRTSCGIALIVLATTMGMRAFAGAMHDDSFNRGYDAAKRSCPEGARR